MKLDFILESTTYVVKHAKLLTNNSMLSLQSTASWNREYYVCKFKFSNVFHNMNIVFSKCLFPSSNKKLVHSKEWQFCTMLCYAKSLQSCPTLCDPIDGSHQAPPSLGFSRQAHWSGLSFPSPMHESEKWKWSRSVVSNSSRPHGLQPTRLLRPWDFPGKSTGVGCHCLL